MVEVSKFDLFFEDKNFKKCFALICENNVKEDNNLRFILRKIKTFIEVGYIDSALNIINTNLNTYGFNSYFRVYHIISILLSDIEESKKISDSKELLKKNYL